MKNQAFKKTLSKGRQTIEYGIENLILVPLVWIVSKGFKAKESIDDTLDKMNVNHFLKLMEKLKEISAQENNTDSVLLFKNGERVIIFKNKILIINNENNNIVKTTCFAILNKDELFERIEILKENFKEEKNNLKLAKAIIKRDKINKRISARQFSSLKPADVTLSIKSKTDQFLHLTKKFNFLTQSFDVLALGDIDEIKVKLETAQYMSFWSAIQDKDLNVPFLPLLWSAGNVTSPMREEIGALLDSVYLNKSISNAETNLKVDGAISKAKLKI